MGDVDAKGSAHKPLILSRCVDQQRHLFAHNERALLPWRFEIQEVHGPH